MSMSNGGVIIAWFSTFQGYQKNGH